MDIRIKAIIATAKAYLARGVYLQYDDSRLVAGDVVSPPVYRWARHVNGPEDSTRQHTCYTNCAAFCYDVYKEALGLDIVTWCTEMMIAAGDMHAFRYEVRGDESDEEKKNLEKAYRAALRPGDIIVSRHSLQAGGGGHAMLYIGDGKIIHSSAPGGGSYDYENKRDKYEAEGSIAYMELDDLFMSEHKRYFFRELNFAIVRPLIKYPDACVTESAASRVKNMEDIFAEKLCSHITGQTAMGGEEISFTYYIRNDSSSPREVSVQDRVPEGTEYVSGGETAEGDILKWNISLESGEGARFGYTVRVKAETPEGAYIQSEGAVGGVYIRCPKVYIAQHLNENEAGKITSVCKGLADAPCGKEMLADLVYREADVGIIPDNLREILCSIFVPHKGTDTHFELNTESPYFKRVVPAMYGGRYVATSPAFCGVRTSGIFACEIMAGDIIIAAEDAENGELKTAVYCGEGKCLTVENGRVRLNAAEECDGMLMSLPAYYKFVVIRP